MKTADIKTPLLILLLTTGLLGATACQKTDTNANTNVTANANTSPVNANANLSPAPSAVVRPRAFAVQGSSYLQWQQRDASILVRQHPLVTESDPHPLRRSHPPLLGAVTPENSAIVSWLVSSFLQSIITVLRPTFLSGHWVAKLCGSSRRAPTLPGAGTVSACCLCWGSLRTACG